MNSDQLKSRGYVEVAPGNWQKPKFLPPDGEPEQIIGVPVDREAKLHEQIENDLVNRRWFYVHSRMDKRSTNQLGTPDYIVALPNGKTLWLELKRKGGKLTKEQQITKHVLLALDHAYFTVFSFEEYLQVISGAVSSQRSGESPVGINVAQEAQKDTVGSCESAAPHPTTKPRREERSK